MAEQQLIDYIKKTRQAGQTDDKTKSLLKQNGWSDQEVNEAFSAVAGASQPQQQQREPKVEPQNQPKIQYYQQAKPQEQQPQQQPRYQRPQPQAQPQLKSQQQVQQSYMPQSRSSHTGLKIFVVLLILLVLCGAGAAYVIMTGIYTPSAVFSNPDAQKILSSMISNMQGIKQYSAEASGEIDAADSSANNLGKATFSLSQKADLSQDSPVRDFTGALDFFKTGSETASTSIEAEAIIAGGSIYLKFDKLATSDIPMLNASAFLGKWLKTDQDSMAKIAEIQESQADFLAILQNVDLQSSLLSQNVSFASKFADEAVNGQDAYHYSVKIGGANGEVWIGKKDFLLYKYKIEKSFDAGQLVSESSMQLTLKIDTTLSDFGQAVSITEPEDSQKIEDTILPALKAQKVKINILQVAGLAKSIFGSDGDYSSLCNRNLLNGYQQDFGAELIILNNEIIKLGGLKPACYSSALNFCVSTQFSDGSWLCVDKNMSAGTTKCVSAATVCK